MTYGLIFWGDSSQEERLSVVQEKALRTMLRMKNKTSCRSYINILILLDCLYTELCFFFIKIDNTSRITPEEKLQIFSYRLSLTERNPIYTTIKLFNLLVEDLEDVVSYTPFRKSLLRLMQNTLPYSVFEFINACGR